MACPRALVCPYVPPKNPGSFRANAPAGARSQALQKDFLGSGNFIHPGQLHLTPLQPRGGGQRHRSTLSDRCQQHVSVCMWRVMLMLSRFFILHENNNHPSPGRTIPHVQCLYQAYECDEGWPQHSDSQIVERNSSRQQRQTPRCWTHPPGGGKKYTQRWDFWRFSPADCQCRHLKISCSAPSSPRSLIYLLSANSRSRAHWGGTGDRLSRSPGRKRHRPGQLRPASVI